MPFLLLPMCYKIKVWNMVKANAQLLKKNALPKQSILKSILLWFFYSIMNFRF